MASASGPASCAALLKGWSVAEDHIYADDAVSGAEFVKRPGFLRLMDAACTPRPPFHALVMMENPRLGRESIETAWVLKQITDAGVRFFYLDDRELVLDTAMDKMMLPSRFR